MGADGGHRVPGWADPVRVAESLLSPTGDLAFLDASDGSGRSYLLLGGASRTELPLAALLPDAQSGALPAAFGWFAYDEAARFCDVECGVIFDHGQLLVEAFGGGEGWAQRVETAVRNASLGAEDASQGTPSSADRTRSAVWRHDDTAYLAMIEACQAAIHRGDAYQLCLTNTATVLDPPDAWRVFLRLRASSPTHHGAFVRIGDTTLVSATPERFLVLDAQGGIRSSPIKGTRARGADGDADRAAIAELQASVKERAENLMIVDLVRNDLNRVSDPASVRVSQLFEVESYAQVHQLVSTVEAVLRPDARPADAVDALFPAGSMTGAPKASAMSILADLEQGPRGLYAGAFGFQRRDGSLDLAMTIRSVVLRDGVATVGAGGGITSGSVPLDELAEVRIKAAPLLAALGVRTRT